MDPIKSNARMLSQGAVPNESNLRNESHVALFRHQRVHWFFKSGICHNLNGDFNEAKGVNKNVKIVI